ncbi:MAG: hypoxanthine phosphoribosyltransferase [Candidatus Aegiribacteria sp.]|nr:hypoxanthine phosphoribosyltransferase [Candidatus Aegiribacteria sp.]MBD3294173.1 hypoxanthine phosphoribosyltransferase [Candidatus Fermentibacteria bacterium]
MKEPDHEVLISAERIKDGVKAVGAELTEIYRGTRPVVIPLLRGGFMFAADLVRSMDIDLQIEFIGAASYGEQTESSGEVRLTLDTTLPLTGRHVLLVEDIVDTGLTLAYIQKLIKSREPASLRTVVLLDKKIRRKVDVDVDRVIFEIPDRFVFGYGLDSPGGFNRNLSDIVAIRE